MRKPKLFAEIINKRIIKKDRHEINAELVFDKPIKDLYSELDDFMDQLRVAYDNYKDFRTMFNKASGKKAYRFLGQARRNAILYRRTMMHLIKVMPAYDSKNNLKIARRLYMEGLKEDAIEMATSLGVNIEDYLKTKKVRGKARKKNTIKKEDLEKIEKKRKEKKKRALPYVKGVTKLELKKLDKFKVVISDEEPKRYYYNEDQEGNFVIHDKPISPRKYISKYILRCVEAKGRDPNINKDKIRVGQFAKTKSGQLVKIVGIIKRRPPKKVDKKVQLLKDKKRKEVMRLRMRKIRQAEKEKLHEQAKKEAAKERKKQRLIDKKNREKELYLLENPKPLTIAEIAKMRPKRSKFQIDLS